MSLSFARKDRLRFSIEVDFTVENVKVEITGPQWSHIERKAFLLNGENLRSLAKRMCPVGEGQAIIPVHLLALGGFDITHHLIMYLLKPIEQGLDVKFTAGIHRGCLRIQSAIDGNIKTVQDLRGKRIGVPGMGTPPFIFANRVLTADGMDASRDVTWSVFPAGELGLALEKGEVDAVADSEPIGTLLLADGKVRNVVDQATDSPYKDEYCCAEGVALACSTHPLKPIAQEHRASDSRRQLRSAGPVFPAAVPFHGRILRFALGRSGRLVSFGAYEIFRKIDRGEIRGLLSISFNPIVSLPENDFVRRALEKLEFAG